MSNTGIQGIRGGFGYASKTNPQHLEVQEVRRPLVGQYYTDYQELFHRGVDRSKPLHTAKGTSFYIFSGVLDMLKVAESLTKLLAKNFFSIVSQYISVVHIIADSSLSGLAYFETHENVASGKKLRNSPNAHIKSAGQRLLEHGLREKVLRILAFFASPLHLGSAIIAIVLHYHGKKVTPLSPESGIQAVVSFVGKFVGTALKFPFYVQAIIETVKKLRRTYKVQKLVDSWINKTDDRKLKACLRLIRREQRPKELALRLLALAIIRIKVILFITWGVFQLMALGRGQWGVWAAKWALMLKEPLLVLNFIGSGVNAIQGGVKIVWDGYKTYLGYKGRKALEDNEQRSIVDSDSQLAAVDKHYACFCLIKMLEVEHIDAKGFIMALGVGDEEIGRFKQSSKSVQDYEVMIYKISDAGMLFDTVSN